MTGLVVYLAIVIPLAALACGHQGVDWPLAWAWRTVRTWMPRPAASARATRPRSPSRPAGTIPSLTSRQTAVQSRTPSWAVTDHHNRQDAA